MSGAIVGAIALAAALFTGWCLTAQAARPTAISWWPDKPLPRAAASGHPATRGRRGFLRPKPKPPGPDHELQRASLLVAQLAALLRAGRSPEQMWRQAAEMYVMPGTHATAPSDQGRWPMCVGARSVPEDLTARVLGSASRAAALGRPAAAAIQDACTAGRDSGGSRRPATTAQAGVWSSVAACIETAEASGSPLAGVLDRVAAQLEADADAAAARAVALAGPRATAQVLSVLPLAGLGLGMLMGADPLGVLLSTPLGSLCLAVGGALTVAGRSWSARLVRSASETR